MADVFQGRTMTEAYRFVSAGAAHTFTWSFEPDKVVFNNLTQWKATAGGHPINVWLRDQTTAAHAYQHQVIDSSAGASFNFVDAAALGFTVANTTGGSPSSFALIAGVTQADPCVVTTTAAHGFQDGQIVRITDLGSDMPVVRGMDEINNKRYKIVVTAVNAFSLQDPISGDDIDSSGYVAWVAGGRVALESHVITLNNPQSGVYTRNPFVYDPITYRLTVDTAVMGANLDVFLVEVYKFGQIIDLGSL
jgi:hypothetical protein